MTEIQYEIVENELHFIDGVVTRFQSPIGQVIQFDDLLIVRLKIVPGVINENVFGIDRFGKLLWQIEPQYPSTIDAAFGGMHRSGDFAVLSNYLSDMFYLEPATGAVLKRAQQPY